MNGRNQIKLNSKQAPTTWYQFISQFTIIIDQNLFRLTSQVVLGFVYQLSNTGVIVSFEKMFHHVEVMMFSIYKENIKNKRLLKNVIWLIMTWWKLHTKDRMLISIYRNDRIKASYERSNKRYQYIIRYYLMFHYWMNFFYNAWCFSGLDM